MEAQVQQQASAAAVAPATVAPVMEREVSQSVNHPDNGQISVQQNSEERQNESPYQDLGESRHY